MAIQEFVTLKLAHQLLGIPVLSVQDVLKPHKITPTPLAPDWVEGVLNLRGKIVTAIDMRRRLGLPPRQSSAGFGMSIVIEYQGEPYSLLIDSVCEVLALDDENFEKNPVTLDSRWRQASAGIYQLKDELLIILDVERLLDLDFSIAA